MSRGNTSLLKKDSCLSSCVSREATTALLLDSGFSSSMGLDAGKTSSRGNVSSDYGLLGTDYISSSWNIRYCKESGGGITVRVVGAGGYPDFPIEQGLLHFERMFLLNRLNTLKCELISCNSSVKVNLLHCCRS